MVDAYLELLTPHMLPFHGFAHVAYLPGERIVGLSKLARVVEMFARDRHRCDFRSAGAGSRRPPHPPGVPLADPAKRRLKAPPGRKYLNPGQDWYFSH
jgi:hypothetical protein